MLQNEILQQYVDPRYQYKFSHGPDLVRSKAEALEQGINCISLAHLALRDLFNVTLPIFLQCAELHRDREYFEAVGADKKPAVGDLVWFGVDKPKIKSNDFEPIYHNDELINWRDYPVKHVGIYAGEADDIPQILHSTPITGTNSVWSLEMFANYRRYMQVYNITRLRVD